MMPMIMSTNLAGIDFINYQNIINHKKAKFKTILIIKT
jgi:hypothetical protein